MEKSKDLIAEYEAEKDQVTKLELQYRLGQKLIKEGMLEVFGLNERDWSLYVREIWSPLNETYGQIGKEYLNTKLSQGELDLEAIDLLLVNAELAETYGKIPFTRAERQLIKDPKNLERAFTLLTIAHLQSQLFLGTISVRVEPYIELNEIIARRFSADENWSLAVSILAVQENLVKKKLVEIGVTEEQIEHISRNPKEGFNALVDLLAKEIKAKEKRDVSLSFYQSSSLRNVRNRLEHAGYKHKVTKAEMLRLLKDIKVFETEIFGSNTDSVQRPISTN